MPRSSVFLRLQWPSTSSSSESSQELASIATLSSLTSFGKMCPCSHSSSLNTTHALSMKYSCSSETMNSLCAARSSPIVKSGDIDQELDGNDCGGTYTTKKELVVLDPVGKEEEMSAKVKNVKLRQKAEGAKAKRIARSLSASSATVSTNTDPEDFLYVRLASKTTSTLPKNFKDKGSRIIIPRVPMETTEEDTTYGQNPTTIDLEPKFLENDFPYIDVEYLNQGGENGSNSVNSLKVKKRSSKDDMFCLPKYRFHSKSFSLFSRKDSEKLKSDRSSTLEVGASNSRFSPLPEEAEEEGVIPDILSDCKIHSSYLTSNSSHPSREMSPISRTSATSTLSENYQAELPEEEFDDSSVVKKSVKFLLPPEYWDSFLSEADESFSGEYPPSGYAELDGSLMPPNGQDPYRNTPSPGLHGVPNDRYEGVYEGEGYLGEYPDDGGFKGGRNSSAAGNYPRDCYTGGRQEEFISPVGAEGGYMNPRDIDPYQMGDDNTYVRVPPRPPSASQSHYPMNGSHQHPYEEELSQRHTPSIAGQQMNQQISVPNTPILPPHKSPGPATPLLTPSGHHPTHDTYAPPSLLRSPSADSTSRVRWRDPDLHEVIDFLSNPNNVVKANAAAYLQHLCYMDDATKQKSRILGGIPPLVALLSHDLPELHRNACGALRNLSYGRQNDENKQAIKEAGGLPALVRLLRKTLDNEVKELVTGILWNLSSCEELKQSILDDTLAVLVNHVIIPCSGWDGGEVERDPNNDVWWSTVFKNASGVIRNISSAGEYARTKLRHCHGLVDSLFCVIKLAINGNSHDNKSVENCVCILRNLSYRCQEVEDPNYDKHQLPVQCRATASGKGDNLGCFGGSRKKKEMVGGTLKDSTTVGGSRSSGQRGQPVRGMELLWQPDLVVQPYLALLSDCSNPETLEAAAGAIQNLAACYWQPSIDVRAAVRKEKGLPILVELLRMEVDRVVCAVATALRNLAIDQRNKELIGKYAMRDLVQKLPSQNSHDTVTSDETIAAVLATLNEVIKKNAEFSRSLLDAGGIDRLVYITRQRGRYSTRVVKFASQVLFSMWGHQELREVYKKAGWKEQDFVSKSVAARNASGGANSPTANNTLNRPMASQGGTRYEDRTIQRSNNQHKHHQQQYSRREEVPLADLGYGGGELGAPGGVRLYTTSMQGKPGGGEPVYAKVNRDKKRNRQYESEGIYGTTSEDWGEPPPAYTMSSLPASHPSNYSEPNQTTNTSMADMANNNEVGHLSTGEPAGDSWV